jgi:hypothetical protein
MTKTVTRQVPSGNWMTQGSSIVRRRCLGSRTAENGGERRRMKEGKKIVFYKAFLFYLCIYFTEHFCFIFVFLAHTTTTHVSKSPSRHRHIVLSSRHKMSRPRRSRDACPVYVEDEYYTEADVALRAIGQDGIRDSRPTVDVRQEDHVYRVPVEGGETSSESGSEGEEEERDGLRTTRRSARMIKSAEWLTAERNVAVRLDVNYPSGLAQLVAGLSYVSHALSAGMSVADQTRVAFRRLMWNTPVTDLDRDACIAYTTALSRTVTVDNTELCDIFAPLEKFTGGRLVKAKQHIVALFAIALMAQMVDAMLYHRAHGTQQAQDFQRLLAAAGLDPNAIAVLVPQACTETAQDCAERAGRELALALNRLTPAARIAAMFKNLASFEQIARQHPPPTDGRARWCRFLFDHTRPRNVHATACGQGAAIVSVTLLVRDAHTRYAGARDRVNGLALLVDQALPDGFKVSQALYQPRLSMANLEGGALVATHRAHAQVLAPTDVTVVQAMRDLLLPPADRQTKLSDFLDRLALQSPERFAYSPDGLRGGVLGLSAVSHGNGSPASCAYLAVRYGGRLLKLGRNTPRCRSFAPELVDTGRTFGTVWLEVDAALHLDELRTLLVPPFVPLLGHIEIFVALTEPPPCGTPDEPEEGPLSLRPVRLSVLERNVKRARKRARRQYVQQQHLGPTLNKSQRTRVAAAMDAAETAVRTSAAVRIEYPQPPVAHSASTLERADVTRNAMATFEAARRAEPGGVDARAAAARFASLARP